LGGGGFWPARGVFWWFVKRELIRGGGGAGTAGGTDAFKQRRDEPESWIVKRKGAMALRDAEGANPPTI